MQMIIHHNQYIVIVDQKLCILMEELNIATFDDLREALYLMHALAPTQA
jgi:hypothetical protein